MSTHLQPPDTFAPPRQAQEISEGIYAYVQPDGSWWINNTGFLVGRRGVISIDACATQARTEAYLEAIAEVSDQPVRTVINTHHHGDHTFGNYLFRGATIVGHQGIREAVFAWGPPRAAPYWTPVDWGEIELEPPFLTFGDRVDVYVDDLQCEVSYIGLPAHTTTDSYVWIPDRGVLFTGDLVFNGGTPFLVQGSISGALLALGRLRGLRPRIIVPGHGPVCGPEALDVVEGYLRFVKELARRGKDSGLSPLDVARCTDLGPYAELTDSERIVGNLHRAFAELDGVPPGGRIDAMAALDDMVTFNGGRPLSCHA